MTTTTSTPLAAASFPRYVNTQTNMQAAAPAVEVTRLLRRHPAVLVEEFGRITGIITRHDMLDVPNLGGR